MQESRPSIPGNSAAIRTGLIGEGILESRSPWLHEQEAGALGLSLDYALFDFADRGWARSHLPGLLAEMQQAGFSGTNITYPFKQTVIPLLDELSEDAASIGAVNTIAFAGGRSVGFNTDMLGFAEGVRRGLPQASLQRVLQLGCGGAGAAVAHALLGSLEVGTLLLHDIDPARAGQLRDRLAARFGAARVALAVEPGPELAACDGLVNATPIGMAGVPGLPLALDALQPAHWVADIVYFPLQTMLLEHARTIGCATLDGSRMVVHQAAEAFRIMTGQAADAERMMQSFFAHVASSPHPVPGGAA